MTIKLSMEVPNGLLEELPYLTDFDFALTHNCEEFPDYLDHYKSMVKAGREVILDNSVNELGEPCSLDRMDAVVKRLHPTYIIPPDHLNNMDATLRILDQAIGLWGRDRLIPVLQGENLEDVVNCARVYKELYNFKIVSIPYDITLAHRSKLPESDTNRATLSELGKRRVDCMTMLKDKGLEFNRYHLLGFNTLSEFIHYTTEPYWVSKSMSIDTGAPITNALHDRRFCLDNLVPKGVYFDYAESIGTLGLWKIQRDWLWNILMLRRSLGDHI